MKKLLLWSFDHTDAPLDIQQGCDGFKFGHSQHPVTYRYFIGMLLCREGQNYNKMNTILCFEVQNRCCVECYKPTLEDDKSL